MFNSLGPHGLQHTRLPCPLATPGPCSNSHPSSQWCHPTISSTVISISSCLQSFPASGSFPMSHFFAWGSQSFGASASVLLMSIQDWFPLGLTGLISCRRKDSQESRVQKHQFFGVHLSLWSNSSMTAGIIIALTRQIFVGKVTSLLFLLLFSVLFIYLFFTLQYCVGFTIHWLFNMQSRLVIAFLPESEHLLISWLDHNKLQKILKENGMPDHLTCLLRNQYAGQEANAG